MRRPQYRYEDPFGMREVETKVMEVTLTARGNLVNHGGALIVWRLGVCLLISYEQRASQTDGNCVR